MESYKKPTIVAYDATRGIIPVAAVGAAVGAAATKLAGKITLTDPVLSLTERKNFA